MQRSANLGGAFSAAAWRTCAEVAQAPSAWKTATSSSRQHPLCAGQVVRNHKASRTAPTADAMSMHRLFDETTCCMKPNALLPVRMHREPILAHKVLEKKKLAMQLLASAQQYWKRGHFSGKAVARLPTAGDGAPGGGSRHRDRMKSCSLHWKFGCTAVPTRPDPTKKKKKNQ